MTISIVDERPPLRLAASIDYQGGRQRWGGDEPDAENVPANIEFSTSMPGGFKTATCKLTRRDDRDWPDLDRFNRIRFYGAGNRTGWGGRLAERPTTHGDELVISPGAVGMSSHLKDDTFFREIYVHRDLTAWTGTSVARRVGLMAAGYTPVDPTTVPGPAAALDGPCLECVATGPWEPTTRPIVEAYLDTKRIPLAALDYMWIRGSTVNPADPNWAWYAGLADSDTPTAIEHNGNLRATGPGAGTATATGARYLGFVQFVYNLGLGDNESVQYPLWWPTLAAHGAHGLTRRGAVDTAGNASGYLVSDVLRHIIQEGAPLLTTTTDSISPTAFIVPHLAFMDPTTPETAVNEANKFEGMDWYVYEDDVFHAHPPGSYGTTWRVSLKDVKFADEGPKADETYNGVVVQYTDVTGATRTVGPPNSGAGVESATLLDADPLNPATAAGITRRWASVTMGTSTSDGAIKVGQVFLKIAKEQRAVRGDVTITGYARDDANVIHPAWAMRAGDQVVIEDAADKRPHRIVDTNYSHQSFTLTAGIDAKPNKLDKLIEQLGVLLRPLGFS